MEPPFKSVFIGGTGRSGTTIVGKLLARHEQVHAGNPYEIKFLTGKGGLLDLVEGASNLQKQDKSRGNQIASSIRHSINMVQSKKRIGVLSNRICNDWWERQGKRGDTVGLKQGFSREVLLHELEKLNSNYREEPLASTRSFFYQVVSSNQHFADSKLFVDTTPTNIERAHQIAALLEGVTFIHMQRGGKDTISSILSEPWGPNEPLAAISWWKRKLQSAHKAKEKLNSDHYLDIRLEDLVIGKRDETYAKILNFLEITDQDRINRYFNQEVNAEKAHIDRWKTDKRLDSNFHAKFSTTVSELNNEGIEAY
jgi:hypothetical protein